MTKSKAVGHARKYGETSYNYRSMEEAELIGRAAAGEIEAKLELVRQHLDLVVEIAVAYASQTGRPFSQLIQAGASAVIRAADEAADEIDWSQESGFVEFLRRRLVETMESVV